MIYIRQYKKCDATEILSWINDEREFRMWSADRYEHYPITPDDLNYRYFDQNGCIKEEDNFYPFTAYNEFGLIGHFILRYTNSKQNIHIGFVLINNKMRGIGIGKELMRKAVQYSFDFLGATKVDLGVYEGNTSAIRCYESVGFTMNGRFDKYFIENNEWKFLEMEIYKQ